MLWTGIKSLLFGIFQKKKIRNPLVEEINMDNPRRGGGRVKVDRIPRTWISKGANAKN